MKHRPLPRKPLLSLECWDNGDSLPSGQGISGTCMYEPQEIIGKLPIFTADCFISELKSWPSISRPGREGALEIPTSSASMTASRFAE